MPPHSFAVKDNPVDTKIAWLGGTTATVVNRRQGRDPGGEYLIVVIEIGDAEEVYADFRFYGNTPETSVFELAE